MIGAVRGHLAKMHSFKRLNTNMKFAPLFCQNPLLAASKEEVGLNLWESMRSSLPAWIWLHAPIQVWKLPPRNIRAWKPLETRGNQAGCSQQCNQCILWAGPTSNQVRVGRDWRWVEIKRAFEFGFSKMYVFPSFHEPLIPWVLDTPLRWKYSQNKQMLRFPAFYCSWRQ